MKLPPELLDAQKVKRAIDSARAYAEDKGVAMTVERLAVFLGVPSRKILEFALRDEEPNDDLKESFSLLKMACEEIAASHIEHGMTKGNNPSMDILMLKNNLNYRDKQEQTVQNTAVIFLGEDAIKD